MNWLSLVLASTGMHASISVADKVILERYLKNKWAYPFFTALFLGLYCLALVLARLALGVFQPASWLTVVLALLPGVLHYAAALTFTRALLQADAATVAGIAQVSPIFGVVWGTLFLGDRFTPLNYAGIFLIVACAVLLAWENPAAARLPGAPTHSPRRGRLSWALWLVLFGAFLKSLSDLFTKIAVTDLVFWDAFALSRLGTLLPALLLFMNPSVRGAIVQPLKQHGVRVLALIAGIEVLALLNLVLVTAAYARGPLAFVSAAQSAVPVLILALTGLLNRLRPGTVAVKANGLPTAAKLSLSGGLVCGVLLLTL